MKSRTVIEQAKGMLMADHSISPDDAFAILARLSQKPSMKLRDVAQRLVRGRQHPDSDAADQPL